MFTGSISSATRTPARSAIGVASARIAASAARITVNEVDFHYYLPSVAPLDTLDRRGRRPQYAHRVGFCDTPKHCSYPLGDFTYTRRFRPFDPYQRHPRNGGYINSRLSSSSRRMKRA